MGGSCGWLVVVVAVTACGSEVIYDPGGGGGAGAGPTGTTDAPPATSSGTTTTSTTTGSSSQLPCGAGKPPCPPTEYCDLEGCEGTGKCTLPSVGCGQPCPGVCGCDGQTYCSVCEAQAQGIDVGSTAPCPN